MEYYFHFIHVNVYFCHFQQKNEENPDLTFLSPIFEANQLF